MSSVTLTYDSNDVMAQKVIDFVLSLNLFKAKQVKTTHDDPAFMSKDAYFAMIDESKAQADRGEGVAFTNLEAMHQWVNAL